MSDRLSTWSDVDGHADEAVMPEPRLIAGEARVRVTPPEPYPSNRAPGSKSTASASGGRPPSQGARRASDTRSARDTVQDTARGVAVRGNRPGRRPARGRRSLVRRIGRTLLLLALVLLLVPVGTYLWADSALNRQVSLEEIGSRPPQGSGTNYLIVGSDSREGLTEEDRKKLRTGAFQGGRTDSMILLHTGANGTTMVSLPRDSWVTIPQTLRPQTGKVHPASEDKLNAAYSLGGPQLLVQTVEHNTGLRIDHYVEIGLGGFVDVVDAVGGVEMCVDRDIKDRSSGLDVKRGCQVFHGTTALAFVRQRKQEARGDLGRTRNQQEFLAALAERATRSDVVLNPSRLLPAAEAGLDTLVVDKGTDLPELVTLLQAVRSVTGGGGRQINVPVSDVRFRTSKGIAVRWDGARAKRLFTELRNDLRVTPVSPP